MILQQFYLQTGLSFLWNFNYTTCNMVVLPLLQIRVVQLEAILDFIQWVYVSLFIYKDKGDDKMSRIKIYLIAKPGI